MHSLYIRSSFSQSSRIFTEAAARTAKSSAFKLAAVESERHLKSASDLGRQSGHVVGKNSRNLLVSSWKEGAGAPHNHERIDI